MKVPHNRPLSASRKARGAMFVLCASLGLSAAAFEGGKGYTLAEGAMPIRFVRLIGVFGHIDQSEIRDALDPWLRGGFAVADITAMRAAVEALPWVHRAWVRRDWPDTLVLTVAEEIPRARWREDSLLNAHGARFTPRVVDAFADLPQINGPDGQERFLLRTMETMQRALRRHGLQLSVLQVDRRGSWKVDLAGGVELQLGRREPMHAFERLVRALPNFGPGRIQAIRRVDLRYPNGFAVAWKSATEPAPGA